MTDLDATDIQILTLLQKDASLTHKEMSEKLHKSVAAIHERTRRLKQQGYIKKVVALLDRKKINKSLIAFSHVILNDHTARTLGQFEEEVAKFPEVMECYHMTGLYDYLLKVALGDMDEYYEFIINKIAKLSNVGTVQSFFVLYEAKKETAYRITLPESFTATRRKQNNPIV